MKKSKVFLSAGHRGAKTGAVGYFDEGAEVINLRDLIKNKIESISEIDVIIDDKFKQLRAVVNHINKHAAPNDVSIDIHFNSFSKSTANGTEVLIPDNASSLEKNIANKLAEITAKTLGIRNRGVKQTKESQHSRLAMLDDVNCNTMIWEVCFISNKTDSTNYKAKRTELVEEVAKYLSNIF